MRAKSRLFFCFGTVKPGARVVQRDDAGRVWLRGDERETGAASQLAGEVDLESSRRIVSSSASSNW